MIKKISQPLDEQETIINIPAMRVQSEINVYTSDTTMLNKLWKMNEKYPDAVRVLKDDKYGTEFSLNRDWFSIRPSRRYRKEKTE